MHALRLLILGALTLLCLQAEATNNATVVIDIKQPGATIHRNIYGQFMEHLGRGIYEGIWVGEDSGIPNKNGYRKDVLKALKELQVPLLRWPGGCFADEYHWRDGIGPRGQRTRTINTTWGGVIDDNAFGTHEFMGLAEEIGAEVYVNANLGTGTAAEMAQWLEYMTAEGDSTLARERRANGRDDPWQVHYFAIGNESWGCGGNMRPEFYADLYKQWATFAKTPKDNRPIMIASGGQGSWTNWTETLMTQVPFDEWSIRMQAITHHYYTRPTGKWDVKGRALNFNESEWISTLRETLKMETFLEENIAIMDKHDPDNKVGFYVDEWGTWYDVEEGTNPGFLYQQNTLRDAVVAGMNLNLFHKHARRVQMSIIAQMINVLQAMILTDKEKMLLTPTYHVFKMYIPFQDATSYPVTITGDKGYSFGVDKVPGVSASAAKGKDGKLWLALVNTNPNETTSVTVATGGKLKSAKGEVLTANAMDAHNTFKASETIKPVKYKAKAKDGKLVLELPPKSVVVVEVE